MKITVCDICIKNKVYSTSTRQMSFQNVPDVVDMCESCMFAFFQALVYDMDGKSQRSFFNTLMGTKK